MLFGAQPSLVVQWLFYIFLSVFPIVYTEINGVNKIQIGDDKK